MSPAAHEGGPSPPVSIRVWAFNIRASWPRAGVSALPTHGSARKIRTRHCSWMHHRPPAVMGCSCLDQWQVDESTGAGGPARTGQTRRCAGCPALGQARPIASSPDRHSGRTRRAQRGRHQPHGGHGPHRCPAARCSSLACELWLSSVRARVAARTHDGRADCARAEGSSSGLVRAGCPSADVCADEHQQQARRDRNCREPALRRRPRLSHRFADPLPLVRQGGPVGPLRHRVDDQRLRDPPAAPGR
jgi:hypothetical protein